MLVMLKITLVCFLVMYHICYIYACNTMHLSNAYRKPVVDTFFTFCKMKCYMFVLN